MSELFWWVFASIAIGCGIGTITSRSPVASLMFLVVAFFSLSAIYVLLGAHFIAVVQVIVYAGAILVLFLFVIMLLNLGHDYRSDLRSGGWILTGFGAAGLIGYFVSRSFGGVPALMQGDPPAFEAAVAERNIIGAIAFPMYQDYIVPFELVGLLLLVAIVGAVIMAKRRI
jgi:NADH-quinone oxidoreductase subunit J